MSEPLLISGMRRHPSGTVVHYPEPPIGKCGTSTRGFLAEVDGWLAAEREAGAAEAWKAAADWAEQAGWPMNTAAPVLRLRAALNGGE